jgi:hypothetical protein
LKRRERKKEKKKLPRAPSLIETKAGFSSKYGKKKTHSPEKKRTKNHPAPRLSTLQPLHASSQDPHHRRDAKEPPQKS